MVLIRRSFVAIAALRVALLAKQTGWLIYSGQALRISLPFHSFTRSFDSSKRLFWGPSDGRATSPQMMRLGLGQDEGPFLPTRHIQIQHLE